MIDIALYQPDIAQNAATSVRLAACLGLTIHIIEPAGFVWNARDFRRAGMDYIERANVVRQPGPGRCSWRQCRPGASCLPPRRRTWRILTFGFQADDIILVGQGKRRRSGPRSRRCHPHRVHPHAAGHPVAQCSSGHGHDHRRGLASNRLAHGLINGVCFAALPKSTIVGPDQDDFWLNQPKFINLIASKVLEQLYGFN